MPGHSIINYLIIRPLYAGVSNIRIIYLYSMNTHIVDGNKIARTTMKQLVSQVKDISLAGECANAMDAYNLLQEQLFDLVLLDIEMPGMTGLELTKNLGNKRPVIIFTTSKK